MLYYSHTYETKTNDVKMITHTDFAKRIASGLPTYERTEDANTICKYYFDVDIKIGDDETYCQATARAIEKKCYEYVNDCLTAVSGIKPRIAMATSHGEKKYSVRLYVPNIIDKKSNIKAFVKYVNYIIKQKVDIDNIYDYIEETEDGLFDESVYSNNRYMRCVGTSKPNEDRPLVLIEGSLEDTIITAYFDADALELKYDKGCESPTSVAHDFSVVDADKKDKYIELLFDVIGNNKFTIKFDTWFHIAGILKCNGYDFAILEQYTSIVDKGNPKTRIIWDGIDSKKPMSIYGLQTIAKRINFNGYFDWLAKHQEYITIDTLDKGANEICKFISKTLKSNLIFCNKEWFYCNSQNLWITIDDPAAIIVSAIQQEIDKTLKIKTDELAKLDVKDPNYNSVKADCKTLVETRRYANSQMNAYTKLLKTYLLDDTFENMLDTNRYELSFKNGIVNMKTGEFRKGIRQTDFISKTIPYDYEVATKEEMTIVEKELLKICNNNPYHLAYYLSAMAYSLTGDSSKHQVFFYLLGQKACNGKSVIFDALVDIMPCYVKKVGNDIFNKSNNSLHKSIATWRGARIGFANELTKDKQDTERIKEFSDGNSLEFKGLYKNSAIMTLLMKFWVASNHTLTFDMDNGLKRRIKTLQLDSEFVEGLEQDDPINCRFIRDNSFGERLRGELKVGLVGLILRYAKKFVENGYELEQYPTDWDDEVKAICKDTDNGFCDWFEETFDFHETYKIKCKRVKEMMKGKGFASMRDELKKNKLIQKFKCDEGYNYWLGFKEKEIIEETEC